MIQRTARGLVVVALVGAIAWGGWSAWSRRGAEPVVVASIGSVSQRVVATGRVAPVTEVLIANKVPGRIKAVLVNEGDVVTVGQPLIVFDDHEANAEVRMAEAKVKSAEAEVRRARRAVEAARARWAEIKSGSRPQEIERARAEARQARERSQNADVERRRYERLVREGYVARQQYDSATMEAEVARARMRAAEESLSLVLAGPKKETVQAAWAEVKESEAALTRAESQVPAAVAERDRAHANLKTQTVYATVNGKVTKKLVEPGEAVDIGIPLMVLADVSRVVVKAEIDETDVGKLKIGQRGDVTSEAFPSRIFPSTIYEIGQAIGKRKVRPDDPAKIGDMKVLEAKLDVTKDAEDLRLGMTVDVKITVAERDKVLVLPRYLVPAGTRQAVVAVEGANGPEDRLVTLGLWDEARVEVLSGLKPGDRVLDRRPVRP